ncbi:hypothetical protein [Vibrio barjaei]|uniref:hypothetical protein n=1 Tax=Vibrio barjaei TaxID=1676683 RepID=UPI0022833DAE|nr:hypothetical protein [Vibrio barjaei]MCY9873818.1 hypothetical protein [Vibrio barjaei]
MTTQSFSKIVEQKLKNVNKTKEPKLHFALSILKHVTDATDELGIEVSAEQVAKQSKDLKKLKRRYQDSRWNKPIGYNDTLQFIEQTAKRYKQDQIDELVEFGLKAV